MIPILFEKTETSFTTNGIARLRDIISAVVSEERNGIYELDFEYPINGANYDLIQVGRIVGVTHDETGDLQPFDIVSFEKPIDGVVMFHAVHISYRLSYMSIRSTTAKNSLADAFTHIKNNAQPSCPFTFWTDKTSTGYCSSLQTIPYTVRQVLGGVEGSILDTYGGEYEFDKFTVKLWANRGEYRDFSIRYGVNMLDYNEQFDSSNCYSSCIPYWTDGTTTVVGDKQNNGGIPPSGRDQCVPLDVSEYFESQPTKAQVQTMGLSVMNRANPTVPSQNITVSFVRLQDLGEYSDFQNLLQCKLCDTINVIFPDFNSSGTFKIVKTVWNVLTGKYDEMELGDLSISLSEALGINDIQRDSKSTIEQIQAELDRALIRGVGNNVVSLKYISDGVSRSVLDLGNSSSNVAIGYGGYADSVGQTNVYGNSVALRGNTYVYAQQGSIGGGTTRRVGTPTTDSHASSATSISANSYKELTASFTPAANQAGLTPCIRGWNITGSNSSYVYCLGAYLSGSGTSADPYVAHIKCKNLYSSAVTATATAYIFWI